MKKVLAVLLMFVMLGGSNLSAQAAVQTGILTPDTVDGGAYVSGAGSRSALGAVGTPDETTGTGGDGSTQTETDGSVQTETDGSGETETNTDGETETGGDGSVLTETDGSAQTETDANEEDNTVQLARPDISSLTPAFESITVKWGKVADASGYELYASTQKSGTYVKIADLAASTLSYKHPNLSPSTTYYYKVVAYAEKNGVTSYSAESAVKSAKTALQPVAIKSITVVSYKALKLKWSKNADCTGYYIYRAEGVTGKYKRIATITENTKVTYKDKNLTTGQTYYYKIKAYKTTSAKTYKSAWSEIKKQTAKCAAPSEVKVSSVAYNKLKISWSAVSGANGYFLYRSTKQDGTYTKVATVKNALTYTDTKRTGGKKYYYKIAAYRKVSGVKKKGVLSEAKSGMAVPVAPKGLTVTPQNGKKMALSWSKTAGAQSYTVLRATSKNGTYKVLETDITDLSYTDSGLTAAKRYYYKVLAVRNGADGKKSAAVSAKAFDFGLNKSKVTVIRGGTVKVKANSSGDAAVTWTSANTSIATVTSSGKIKGIKAGSTKVYATSHGVTLTVKVKVTTLENGIDVSHWQGSINWSSVKNAGYSFVMLKATQRTDYTDPTFLTNYNAAKKAGLKVGCYAYSEATSVAAAEAEANYLVQQIGGRSMDYPVVLDFEDSGILAVTDNQTRTDIIFAYQRVIVNAGYKFALYANLNWLTNYIDNSRLVGMDVWIARYRDTGLGHGYTGGGTVTMWQYSSSGSVPGISGNVDMNFCYKAY